MKAIAPRLIASLTIALLTVPGLASPLSQAPDGNASAPNPHDRLFSLFADADARFLELSPVWRLLRGDDRDADSLGDLLTDCRIASRINPLIALKSDPGIPT